MLLQILLICYAIFYTLNLDFDDPFSYFAATIHAIPIFVFNLLAILSRMLGIRVFLLTSVIAMAASALCMIMLL
jgi:hypothetical protein